MKIFDFIQDFNLELGSTLFEIGCHHGYDTDKLIDLCPGADVFVFEPDPRNIEIFKSREVASKVSLFEGCVSDKDGEEIFYLSGGLPPGEGEEIKKYCRNDEWTASSSVRKPTGHIEDHPWCKFEREVKVKSVRLDTFCEEKNIKNIDFIWMDVQGAEDLVFEGACEILKSTHHIYTEYSNKELYESQPTLKRILDRLKDFVVLESFVDGDRGDVLLRNTNYERA